MHEDLAGLASHARIARRAGCAWVALPGTHTVPSALTTFARSARLASRSRRATGAELGLTVEVTANEVLVQQEHIAAISSLSAVAAAAAITAVASGGTQRGILTATSAATLTAAAAMPAHTAAATVAATPTLVRTSYVTYQIPNADG